MKLKVCGLKNRENILEVLECKPDYIGFIFYAPSPRFAGALDPSFVSSITGAKKVGVFVNEKELDILDRVARYGLDYVQLHGDEPPEFCASINKLVPVVKAFSVGEKFELSTVSGYEGSCKYFLFDSKSEGHGGSGRTFDHALLEGYSLSTPYFLSGGLSLENIDGIKQRPFALDVNSKFETAPGLKDVQKIKTLTQKIRA